LLFPFNIRPEAGFDLYAPNVRSYVREILQVLENPCLGDRLRDPTDAPDSEWRWDHFCKMDLPRGLRLIYIWDSDNNFIEVVAFGPHLGHGEFGDVYDGLADMFELPADEGHAQLEITRCCADIDPVMRTVSLEDGEAQIRRMTRR
jgi:hypothetical protein